MENWNLVKADKILPIPVTTEWLFKDKFLNLYNFELKNFLHLNNYLH